VAVPVQYVNKQGYLKEVTVTPAVSAVGGASSTPQTALKTDSISTGFNMQVIPKITSTGDVFMQVSLDLSSLNSIDTFSSGDNTSGQTVQYPNTTNKSVMQGLPIKPGETMMISGFEQTLNSDNTKSMGPNSMWFAGGEFKGKQKKVRTIIMITPYIMSN
jgi:type II secretory pathway component GspD/PulD (secretin)